MKRQVITIDEQTCTGCALCIPNCPEGAIQMIDGKARVVNLSLCDGLGACIGHCPEDAIRTETRDAEAYDETSVIEGILPLGANTLRAHLVHLRDHGQDDLLRQARDYLARAGVADPLSAPEPTQHHHHEGCPGSRSQTLDPAGSAAAEQGAPADGPSALTHWPVQLHLLSPAAPHFRGRDLLLAADCTAFALGSFHRRLLEGKCLAIACPKLDQGQEIYQRKIQALVEEAGVNTITVATMEVPCCGGLVALVQRTLAACERKVPLKHVTVSIRGEVLGERWL